MTSLPYVIWQKITIPVLDQATSFAFGKDTAIYNFLHPSQLKHYIDFIADAGETPLNILKLGLSNYLKISKLLY